MSESTNNPLNDFLNGTEPENDLFAAFSLTEEEEPAPPAVSFKEKQMELPQAQQQTPPAKQTTMFTDALA